MNTREFSRPSHSTTPHVQTLSAVGRFDNDRTRRIIVCGSRHWQDRRLVRDVLTEYLPESIGTSEPTIVHGGCRGADRIAGDVAIRLGFWVEEHPPRWKMHGKAAGPLRNRHMASLGADLVIAFGDGKGTRDMVAVAEAAGIPVRREGLDV